MSKTYFIADLHIGYDWSELQYNRIFMFQKQVEPHSQVILVGDNQEWAWRTRLEVQASPEYQRFIPNALDYIWIEGNHDIEDGKEAHWIEHLKLMAMHGHQFDKLADSAWKRAIYVCAPWVRELWWSSPFRQKMTDDPKLELHNFAIRARAMEWLLNSQHRTLVIGHTHSSCIVEHPASGKRVVNIGSLPEDGEYGEVVNGQVEIRKMA